MSERVRLPQTPPRVVFGGGNDPELHPVTQMPIQTAIGAASPDNQAQRWHIPLIRQQQGPAAAGEMQQKLNAYLALKADQAKLAAVEKQVAEDGIAVD
jgi:hypothetical protein